jgi:hypothetical protein
MATDYDAPRKTEEESPAESLEALQASRGGGAQTAVIDVDENDTAEGIDLPGADLSGEELTVTVVPEQSDEFTCSSCFLVRHRSQVAKEKNGLKYCRDCEGLDACGPETPQVRHRAAPATRMGGGRLAVCAVPNLWGSRLTVGRQRHSGPRH